MSDFVLRARTADVELESAMDALRREVAVEDAQLEARHGECERDGELALRFAARGPEGRVGFLHAHRDIVANAISLGIFLAVFALLAALASRYRFNISISFWPYALVVRLVFDRLPRGRVTSEGIEVEGPSGARKIAFADIVGIGTSTPLDHYGVALALASGERVFLDVGFLTPHASDASAETEEWQKKPTRLTARAWLLEHAIREGYAAWRERTTSYRNAA